MNRTQSIISLAAVVLVYVCSHAGIVLDESAAVEVITAFVGLAAIVWGCVKDHRFAKDDGDESDDMDNDSVVI